MEVAQRLLELGTYCCGVCRIPTKSLASFKPEDFPFKKPKDTNIRGAHTGFTRWATRGFLIRNWEKEKNEKKMIMASVWKDKKNSWGLLALHLSTSQTQI